MAQSLPSIVSGEGGLARYLEEIRRFREEMDEQYRREMEARECPNASSTPTT